MSCFRYLNMNSFDQVDNLTPKQYRIMMKSFELKEVDLQYHIHLQAFLNFAAKAEKGRGKHRRPVYSSFEKFFNYEKAVNDVLKGKKGNNSHLKNLSTYISKQAHSKNKEEV